MAVFALATRSRAVEVYRGDNASVDVKVRVQLRAQLSAVAGPSAPADDPQVLATVGTARVAFGGYVHDPQFAYALQLALAERDYRDGARSPVYDAFFTWRPVGALELRVGQFFVPFDRLRTVREFALQLAERPRPVAELTLDRDVGVALAFPKLFGEGSPLTARLGAFGGGGMGAVAPRAVGGLLVARVELRPLGELDDDEEGDLVRRDAPALAVGVGVAKVWGSSRLRSTSGPAFIGGTVDQRHLAADLIAKWRGGYFAAEILSKRADADGIDSIAADGAPRREATRSAYGWVAQGSYLFGVPVELVGRLARLVPYRGTDPVLVAELDARGQELAFGVNHYMNGHKLKLQATYLVRTRPDFSFVAAEHGAFFLLDASL